MSDVFQKMVDEAVERKLRDLAEKAADRIVATIATDKPEPVKRKRVLFPASAVVFCNPNAPQLLAKYSGTQREVMEAIALISTQDGEMPKAELVRKVLAFLGHSYVMAEVSSVASRACRDSVLLVKQG